MSSHRYSLIRENIQEKKKKELKLTEELSYAMSIRYTHSIICIAETLGDLQRFKNKVVESSGEGRVYDNNNS